MFQQQKEQLSPHGGHHKRYNALLLLRVGENLLFTALKKNKARAKKLMRTSFSYFLHINRLSIGSLCVGVRLNYNDDKSKNISQRLPSFAPWMHEYVHRSAR